MKTFGAVAFEGEDPAPDAVRAEARGLLEASDVVVVRCAEIGAFVPPAWIAYRQSLRDIVGSGQGPFPERPDWP